MTVVTSSGSGRDDKGGGDGRTGKAAQMKRARERKRARKQDSNSAALVAAVGGGGIAAQDIDAAGFGLAQLHQLRGRIGRSERGGRCYLVTDRAEETERLGVLVRSHDGFEIAAQDLRLRGPGDLVGTRQSGAPAFRLSTSSSFLRLLEAARSAARDVAARDDFEEAEELAPLRVAVDARLEASVAATAG